MATPVKYRNGMIGTILFHGMLLFVLLFMAFRTPLPLPAEQGIMVDFGNSDKGFGNFEPRISQPAPALPKTTAATSQPEQQTLTQDIEESVALPDKPKETQKEQPKETQQKETAKVTTPPVEQSKPVERTVDSRALFPGSNNSSSSATSQGEAGGQGNQGAPTGAPNVHVYGEGIEIGGGLAGRGIVGGLPKPSYDVQESGIVVVSVIVDKNGNVTSATAGAKGSTTLNKSLLDAAEKAARNTKFSANQSANQNLEQPGTITYDFKLLGK